MEDETRWYAPRETESVSIVLHGLNMKPRCMNDMVDMLVQSNAEVLRLAMTGHSKSQNAWSFVQRKHWLEDVMRGVEEAANRAERLGVPLHGVGYSMGGQYLVDALSEMGGPTQKNVLLAPSIALKPDAQSQLDFARWLGPLPTPSSLQPEYRSKSTIPGSAYNAMASSQEAIHATLNSEVLNVPTMIVLDPDDEWISEEGIRDFIEKNKLHKWALSVLKRSKDALKGRWHHLVHDKQSVAEHWDTMVHTIREFLSTEGGTQKAKSSL
jgi:esterase/lipase